jgi:hypothetical protein
MAARVSLCDTLSFVWPRTSMPVHSRWLLSHVTCVVRACVVRKRRSEDCAWVNHVVRSELLGPARDSEERGMRADFGQHVDTHCQPLPFVSSSMSSHCAWRRFR